MGNVSITIGYSAIAIAGVILTAAATLLGWIAKAYFKRMDREMAELIASLKESEKMRSESFWAING